MFENIVKQASKLKEKFDFKKITLIYILLFAFIYLIYIMQINESFTGWEADDYTLMTASLINDHNITISKEDIEFAKKYFPEWGDTLYSSSNSSMDTVNGLSGYTARNGEQLAWYAPTYSLYCIPFVFLMSAMGICRTYAFRIANLFIMIIALLVVNKKVKIKESLKFLLILTLSIHPIVFTLYSASAEVFIYSMLLISVVYWMNKEYHKAALFCSIAATMNVTILVWGAIMIAIYLYNVGKSDSNRFNIKNLFINWKKILIYGSCYIIAIIPLIFNYYQIGHINLSAAGMTDKNILSILSHFVAYFFDLNFGFLPYFFINMILAVVVFIISIIKKNWKYSALFIALLGITLGYSMMIHINCGMDAISRYNSWNSVFLIAIVFYGIDELVNKKNIFNGAVIVLIIELLITFLVLRIISIKKYKANYMEMLPVASYVLDNFPSLYNPLHSTFNSRVNHIDGGYDCELPIIYYNNEGVARKILVDKNSVDTVKEILIGNDEDLEWLNEKLSNIEKEQYISIGNSRSLCKYIDYNIGEKINFYGYNSNANIYIEKGISSSENLYTWSNGKKIILKKLKVEDANLNDKYTMKVKLFMTYGKQRVVIKQGNDVVFQETLEGENELLVPVTVNNQGIIDITIELPDAVSPKRRENSKDTRVLAIALQEIVILDDDSMNIVTEN